MQPLGDQRLRVVDVPHPHGTLPEALAVPHVDEFPVLADLGPADPLIVFIEVVATDGAVTTRRREALFTLTDEAGFSRGQVAFLTAYRDREAAGFRKTVSGLAWGSFAWFVSEPDSIVILRDGAASPARLADLLTR